MDPTQARPCQKPVRKHKRGVELAAYLTIYKSKAPFTIMTVECSCDGFHSIERSREKRLVQIQQLDGERSPRSGWRRWEQAMIDQSWCQGIGFAVGHLNVLKVCNPMSSFHPVLKPNETYDGQRDTEGQVWYDGVGTVDWDHCRPCTLISLTQAVEEPLSCRLLRDRKDRVL